MNSSNNGPHPPEPPHPHPHPHPLHYPRDSLPARPARAAKYKIPIHPLHAQGFPSIGDAKDTVKVPIDVDRWTDR